MTMKPGDTLFLVMNGWDELPFIATAEITRITTLYYYVSNGKQIFPFDGYAYVGRRVLQNGQSPTKGWYCCETLSDAIVHAGTLIAANGQKLYETLAENKEAGVKLEAFRKEGAS